MKARREMSWKSSLLHPSTLCLVGILLGLSPLLLLQFQRLINQPHFQFFPLSFLFVIGLLFYEGRPKLVDTKRSVFGWCLFLASATVGCASLYLFTPLFAHVALILGMLAWGILVLGNLTWSRVTGACLTLFVCVPLPGNMDQELIRFLQRQSSVVCEKVLDALKVPMFRSGNLIELANRKLFVEEACSGVDSLYALAAVAAGMLVLTRTPFVPSMLTMLTVPCWAILGNLCRLVVITLGLHYLGFDLSTGMPHQILGLIVFVVVSCCHLATAQMFRYLTCEVEQSTRTAQLYNSVVTWPTGHHADATTIQTPASSETEIIFESGSSRLFWVLAAAIRGLSVVMTLVLLGFGLMAFQVITSDGTYASSRGIDLTDTQAEAFPGESMKFPMNISTQFSSEKRTVLSDWGKYSRSWRFSDGGISGTISLDMPFYTWHDLTLCYSGVGWKVDAGEPIGIEKVPAKYFEISNESGAKAHVWFWHFDARGNVVPSLAILADRSRDNLFKRWKQLGKEERSVDSTMFQVQLIVDGSSNLTLDQQKSFAKLFEACFESLRNSSIPVLEKIANGSLH